MKLAAMIAAVGLLLLCAGYWHITKWAVQPIQNAPIFFDLMPGESLSDLIEKLDEAGFENSNRLLLLARLTGLETSLQAGEYQMSVGMTPRQLLSMLRDGSVVTHRFRVREGITVAVLLRQLRDNDLLSQNLSAATALDLTSELALDAPFVEGMFFPDTYYFRRGDSTRDILLRAYDAMRLRMLSAWQKKQENSALKSPFEMVILASIIEMETGLESDRTLISQVFHNRLGRQMRLQTDPTVIYLLGAEFDGNLTRAHLRIDSPFNTYQNRGLPPTPIALPSNASLEAAVQPADGDYLYFVAQGDGKSKFSRTLSEHNSAVRTYQLNRQVKP